MSDDPTREDTVAGGQFVVHAEGTVTYPDGTVPRDEGGDD